MIIQLHNKTLDLTSPQIMAIVNATPDSYHIGSRKADIHAYEELIRQYIIEGASIIDIGAQSTRPNASVISAEDEWLRLEPLLQLIATSFPDIIVSIDSFYSSVIERAYDFGIHIVNDISFGNYDLHMKKKIAQLKLPYIGMHIKGTPQTMQNSPEYQNVVEEVSQYLSNKVSEFKTAGVETILIDPGFGFGKTVTHNFQLLKHLQTFTTIGCPILVGLSRKSLIQKTLHVDTAAALNGTTALHMLALQNGANILRVHDVKPAKEAIQLWKAYQNAE